MVILPLHMDITVYYHCNYYPITINYSLLPLITVHHRQLPLITVNYYQLPSINGNARQLPSITVDYRKYRTLDRRVHQNT